MVGRRPINGTPMTRKELAQRAYEKRKRVIADLEQANAELKETIKLISMQVLAATSLYDARVAVAKSLMKKDNG